MRPIYAYGRFVVLESGDFFQMIIYEYLDIAEELASAVSSGLQEELESMKENMQSFLDKEVVKVNDVVVRPSIQLVDVGFRGSLKRPFVEFLIHFKGDLTEGVNTYENVYEPEVATYDYSVSWVLPLGFRVVEAVLGVDYTVGPPNVLRFKVVKGFRTPGYERIRFHRSV
ncbi:MAG: hypothetical protein QXP80_00965 [Zestosphaera sp.]